MSEPFWEESYKDNNGTTFGIEPNPTIYERWSSFAKNGTVLDVGCGDGYAIELMQNSGIVTAVGGIDINGEKVAACQKKGFMTEPCSTG